MWRRYLEGALRERSMSRQAWVAKARPLTQGLATSSGERAGPRGQVGGLSANFRGLSNLLRVGTGARVANRASADG